MEEKLDSGTPDTGVDQDSADGDFNMKSALDSISNDLGLVKADQEDSVITDDNADTKDESTDVDAKIGAELAKTPNKESAPPRPAPSSWAKEQHEAWSKLDPRTQEYISLREKQMLDGLGQYKNDASFGKSLKEIITPYKPMLQAQGVDEAKAVQVLLNAHYKLTTASPAEKANYLAFLAKSYEIDLANLAEHVPAKQDPALTSLQNQVNTLTSRLTEREEIALQAAASQVEKEVTAFASDPSHPYFDEVADDIVAMIQAGANLQDAYDKAIWANHVTREKEIARLNKENEAKLKNKSKTEADAARKAASSNVRSRDTNRTPTEPLGTMEDTMKSKLAEIKARVH